MKKKEKAMKNRTFWGLIVLSFLGGVIGFSMPSHAASPVTHPLFFNYQSEPEPEPGLIINPNCPQGQICCPLSVWCAYDPEDHRNECGGTKGWRVGSNLKSQGGRQLTLSRIVAYRDMYSPYYLMYCYFGDEKDSWVEAVSLQTFTKYNPSGKWGRLFEKFTGKCTTSNSDDCTGIK
jgi:hypothetical protein